MKTAIIFDSCGEESIKFYITDQDVEHFDDFYINSTQTPSVTQDAMVDFFFTESGDDAQTSVSREEFRAAIKNGANLIVCGMLP